MSCWREQKVLRMPASAAGIRTKKAWNAYLDRIREDLTWDPGTFAPSLCESRHGPMIDYILSDRAPVEGGGCRMAAAPLSEAEKEKYYPLFRDAFPGFTRPQMDKVHYCAYTWYDGTDAPYCY